MCASGVCVCDHLCDDDVLFLFYEDLHENRRACIDKIETFMGLKVSVHFHTKQKKKYRVSLCTNNHMTCEIFNHRVDVCLQNARYLKCQVLKPCEN